MTMNNPGAPAPDAPAPIPQLRFTQAFETVRSVAAAIPKDDFILITLDPEAAVTTTIGCIAKIVAQRAQIVEQLPRFDLNHVDRLETYALALGSAESRYKAASKPAEPVQELAEKLIKIRDLLVSDITALANRKLLDGERLKTLNGTHGYRNVGFDVLMLCAMLRENWDSVSGRTGVQTAEINEAEELADRLISAVGRREQGEAAVAEATEMRQRVFTLFMRTYEEVRRAITYLRWHDDDVDRIAPSLYTTGRSARRKSDIEPKPETPPAGGASPASPTGPAAPTAPVATGGSAAPGMPDNEPFGPA
ncbi:MAG: hypothetical protein HOW73_32220 [Polyangiaceae bacterium]|nr:hypothetical protein [Polyangiaceae bacterium]